MQALALCDGQSVVSDYQPPAHLWVQDASRLVSIDSPLFRTLFFFALGSEFMKSDADQETS